jgi:hypothetical protein
MRIRLTKDSYEAQRQRIAEELAKGPGDPGFKDAKIELESLYAWGRMHNKEAIKKGNLSDLVFVGQV